MVIAALAAQPQEQLDSIQIKTGDCDTCGMKGTAGSIDLIFCGSSGCCNTDYFDEKYNFERNSITSFSGKQLGECNLFDLGLETNEFGLTMVITHRGTDDIKIDNIHALTTSGFFKCHFIRTLTGTGSETVSGCRFNPYI